MHIVVLEGVLDTIRRRLSIVMQLTGFYPVVSECYTSPRNCILQKLSLGRYFPFLPTP